MRKPVEPRGCCSEPLTASSLALTLALAMVLAVPVSAQEVVRLVTERDVRVNDDTAAPYVEQTLAVSPTEPDHLVGASMKADSGRLVVVALSSRDGGRIWSEVRVEPCGFDPWVAFLPSGTALLACQRAGAGSEAVLVLRSEDGGGTWQGPTEILPEGGSFDHPTIIVDHTDGPNRGSVYVVAGHSVRSPSGRADLMVPAVVTSGDGGRTFSPPVRLQATNTWAMVSNPVVTPDGTLGFTLVEYAVDYRAAEGFRLLRTQRVWWAASSDGGRSLSIPHLVDEKELMGWGTTAIDATSGPFAGRLYAAHHDLRDGAGGIFVSRSADGGETWSTAVRVGPPFEQDEGFAFRNPHVAVNGRGEVLVTWFANADPPGRSCGRLVATVSIDGGETFLAPVPVADLSSCSDRSANVVERWGRPFDVAERWTSGGDYLGLTPLPDGSFRILWADSRTGVFQIWTDRIIVERTAPRGQSDDEG